MNRIRKIDDKYEVLVTPVRRYDSAMELILGGWSDEKLAGYEIKTFDSINDALVESYKYPQILWSKLISDNVDNFKNLQKTIKNILSDNMFIFEMKSILMTPEQLKNTMFDRVKRDDAKFRLFNNLNDIVCFQLINPWTKNCIELSKILIKTSSLRIVKQYVVNKAIYLVGETATGNTFQIIIMPTIISQFIEWKEIHPSATQQVLENMLSNITKLQTVVDKALVIR